MVSQRNDLLNNKKFLFFWLQEGKYRDSKQQTPEEACDKLRKTEVSEIIQSLKTREVINKFLSHTNEALILSNPFDTDHLMIKAGEAATKAFDNYFQNRGLIKRET